MITNTRAKISLCIIVKNEPFLEQCLLSIKDYVSEIVIVDTGSTDNTINVAIRHANIFRTFNDCNGPDGTIEDFSLARQYSFNLATQPWVMWCDGDDLIEGGEHLVDLIKEYEINQQLIKEGKHVTKHLDGVAYLLPYEYAYNHEGKCTLRHYRERVFSNKNLFQWVNPVHEVVVPKPGFDIQMPSKDNIIFKHQRQYINKHVPSDRNLKILKKYYEKVGDADARQLYYLGLEYSNCGFIDEAIACLIKYINLSGWEDEKVMACIKLIDIYFMQGQYDKALPWAFKAIEIKENWCEGYLYLGKLFYFLAQAGGANEVRNWQKCVYFTRIGLKLPPTQTLLFINPMDREYFAYVYLNFALNKLGDVAGALAAAEEGLKNQPTDDMLLKNKKLYQDFLYRNQVVEAINGLKNNNVIDQDGVQKITSLINNIPESPALLPEQNSIQVVKEDRVKVNGFSPRKLEVVFYIGNGVEEWTPETVKKTGIGGSELMAIAMSSRLAKLGHRVRVYNSCGESNEGIYDGVEYYQAHKYHDLVCDVLIVSRQAPALGNDSVKSRLKLLWVHDIFAISATNELLLKADRILALTNWHKETLVNYHNIHPNHVITTRNGIDLNRFNYNVVKDKFKCVNSSSPDRSWPVLFSIWPKIKENVPKASLHLYYGFKNWEHSAQYNPDHQNLINKLKNQIEEMKSLDVVFHDRISQDELSKELLSAGVWAHPTWFTETSCITAMEMQAAGVRMVTSNIAALKETAGNRAILIDGDWTSKEYQDQFIEAVIKQLTNEDESDRLLLQQYAKDNFDLDSLAKDWENMLYSLFEEIKYNPLIPYFPTGKYKNASSYTFNPVVVDPGKLVKLNIGCGPNVFPFDGWINYDRVYHNVYFTQLNCIAKEIIGLGLENISENAKGWMEFMQPHQGKLIDYLVKGGDLNYNLCDVDEPFPQHADNSVDIIYLGQMIEHLNPVYTIPKLLSECYRMLKPGGTLRITTPDLDLLINAYLDNSLDKFDKEQPSFYHGADRGSKFSYISYASCGPDSKYTNYDGHMFLFNKESMTIHLQKAGFNQVVFFNQELKSYNPIILSEVNDEGLSHSIAVEATK